MTTDQSLPEPDDVARALIDLLPVGREAAMEDLRCADAYGSVVMSVGDLAAEGVPVPADLVERIKQIWPDEGIDLDDMLYERLGNLTVSPRA